MARTAKGLGLAAGLADMELHGPHVIDLEGLNAVRRWESTGVIRGGEAADILEAFQAIGISRYAHTPLLDSVRALRHNLAAYDRRILRLRGRWMPGW